MGMNGVAMPRFEPILSGSVATDSGMPLAALEPPNGKKINKHVDFHIFGARGTPLHVVPDFSCKSPASYNDFGMLRCGMVLRLSLIHI